MKRNSELKIAFRKYFFIFSIALLSMGNACYGSSAADISTLKEEQRPIATISTEGAVIYTSSLMLPSGEIAYFGLESIINKDRSDRWGYYRDSTEYFCRHARGIFPVAVYSADCLEEVVADFFEDKALSANFRALVERISADKKETMIQAFYGCASGTIGMHSSVGDYIAYISKEPIAGFCHLRDKMPSLLKADEYITGYDHIIMSVSVFGNYACVNGTDHCYTHRGIFRNPMSMLRKDYQGIGLLLHAFAGASSLRRDPSLKYMNVNPDLNFKMIELLMEGFDESDMSPGHFKIPDRLSAKFPNKGKNKHAEFCKDSHDIVIKTEALQRKFFEALTRK